jgi:hypothetical protein
MNKYISKLDSERFGFPVAKINNIIEDPDLLLSKLKDLSVKLIIARIEFSNIPLINELERIGFRHKDAQVTFNFNLKNKLPELNYNGFNIVSFQDRHLSEMIKMTRISFNNYGHYFADDKLDKNKCSEIYTDWIRRCCENKEIADEIIVAEKKNIAIGYLAIKKHFSSDEDYISGVIGAVSPENRKLGVFRAINTESIQIASRLGAKRIENNVLITNIPVIKSFTRLGYDIIRSELTMHYWYE